MYFLALLLLIIVIVLIWALYPRTHECFKTSPRSINVACLYAAYNIDNEDADFILKYHKDIPFYIIINGEWTAPCNRINNEANITIKVRENRGYDVGAWKYGMELFKDQLSRYDMILFLNNSCIIGDNMLRICEHASDYDLYSYGFSYELYGRPYDNPHIHSYMFFVSRRLYASQDFTDYWKDMDTNYADHDQSVHKNEYKLKRHFEQLGYKVGAYRFFAVEDTYKYATNNNYCPEIIKKRELNAYPNKMLSFKNGLMHNRQLGY